jgi:alpha-L-fucosidase
VLLILSLHFYDIILVSWHNKTYGPDFKYEEFAPMFQTPVKDVTMTNL